MNKIFNRFKFTSVYINVIIQSLKGIETYANWKHDLHYRHVDVSTLKSLVARWYPKDKVTPKGKAHRALADIRESIDELSYYRKKYFK